MEPSTVASLQIRCSIAARERRARGRRCAAACACRRCSATSSSARARAARARRCVSDREETRHLAEFGVVFLMFSIGLEFSLPQLSAMRRVVFGLGVAQVALDASRSRCWRRAARSAAAGRPGVALGGVARDVVDRDRLEAARRARRARLARTAAR